MTHQHFEVLGIRTLSETFLGNLNLVQIPEVLLEQSIAGFWFSIFNITKSLACMLSKVLTNPVRPKQYVPNLWC